MFGTTSKMQSETSFLSLQNEVSPGLRHSDCMQHAFSEAKLLVTRTRQNGDGTKTKKKQEKQISSH